MARVFIHTSPFLQYIPSTTNTSLIVGVRVRPLLKTEQTKSNRKDIIRVIDGKIVVVLDPDESKVKGWHITRGAVVVPQIVT